MAQFNNDDHRWDRSDYVFHTVNVADNAKAHLGDAHYHVHIQESSLAVDEFPVLFSLADVSAVANLAWKLYKSCNTAPDSFCNISQDLSSLRAVLQECEEIFSSIAQPERRALRLQTITNSCHAVLEELATIVDSFEKLGLQQKRTWERTKWRETDISEIRNRITIHMGMLTAFMSTSQCRVEQKLDALLREYQEGRMEGSVVSRLTVDSLNQDQAVQWRAVRKELEEHGITIEMFHANMDFIFEWFSNAIAKGAFEEVCPDHTSGGGKEISSIEDLNYQFSEAYLDSEVQVTQSRPSSAIVYGDIDPTVTSNTLVCAEQTKPTKQQIRDTFEDKEARNMAGVPAVDLALPGPFVSSSLPGHKISGTKTSKPKVPKIALMMASLSRPRKVFDKARKIEDFETMKAILTDDAKANLLSRDDLTRALFLFSELPSNHYFLKVIQERGANPTDALMMAARSGSETACRSLLEHFDHLDLKMALNEASKYGRANIVRILLEAGANPDSFSLHLAVRYPHPAIVKVLLQAGADPNVRHGPMGLTCLDTVFYDLSFAEPDAADPQILKLLVNHNAASPEWGRFQPLRNAVLSYQVKIVTTLLQNRAKLGIPDTEIQEAYSQLQRLTKKADESKSPFNLGHDLRQKCQAIGLAFLLNVRL